METDLYEIVRNKLDTVSPSLCLAKWTQVTLMLQNGGTSSCCFPRPHRVPLEEIAKNPDSLHNSALKMNVRKEMLEGKRPKECEHCWKMEDVSARSVSERIIKSSDPWSLKRFDEISGSPSDARVTPSYLEVSFTNTCNFACAYCGPQNSSKWADEMRKHGPYDLLPRDYHYSLEWRKLQQQEVIAEGEDNPYVEAFWKWWPELYPNLKVLRITGGEPLLTRNTFRVLDYVEKNPRADLDFAISTNLGVHRKIVDEFADKLDALLNARKIRSALVYTSIDSWGKQAEYIRFGMNFDEYWKTAGYLLERLPNIQLGFMCTTNAMSVPGLSRLLEGILALKRKFGPTRVTVNLAYVEAPSHLSAKILPSSFRVHLEDCVKYMGAKGGVDGFQNFERMGMIRTLEWFKSPEPEAQLYMNRVNFGRFISSYDRRRGLSFRSVFPELSGFLDDCLFVGKAQRPSDP